MAALNGVKTLDMVGGEITKVEYNGAEYVRVDDSASIGDFVQMTKRASLDVTPGKFYKVERINESNKIVMYDDEDDFHTWRRKSEMIHVFRKVSAEATPTVDERVDALEKRVDALEEKPAEAPFKVGDYIVGNDAHRYGITDTDMTLGKVTDGRVANGGDIRVEVLRHATDLDEVGRQYSVESKYFRKATAEEIAEYEESLKPKLKAGDYVKFVKGGLDYTADKAYKILADEDGDLYFIDDAGDGHASELSTEYEIVEPTPFARAGRKEGEFKVGDVVRVTKSNSGHKIGTIGVVEYENHWPYPLVRANGVLKSHLGQMELIAPVESRVDAHCA